MREGDRDILKQDNPGKVAEMFSQPDNSVSKSNEKTKPLREHKFPDTAQTVNQEQEHDEENQPLETHYDRRTHKKLRGNQVNW